MKLQYSAMYFYIVSSFLFKYRDYFISCPCKGHITLIKSFIQTAVHDM